MSTAELDKKPGRFTDKFAGRQVAVERIHREAQQQRCVESCNATNEAGFALLAAPRRVLQCL
jgi:hypothetical protein